MSQVRLDTVSKHYGAELAVDRVSLTIGEAEFVTLLGASGSGKTTCLRMVAGFKPNYPLIGDHDLKVAKLYGMLPASAGDTAQGRTPADNFTVRNVFVIGPDRTIRMIMTYPMTTGRNFDEVLRVIDSLQLTAKHKVATPANWKQGDNVIITGAVSDEEAKVKFPHGWQAPKPYIRIVAQPKD